MKNFFSLKKGAILLLMACILIITVSIIMHKMSNTNAIHEVVAFGELIWNKSIPFEVKSDKTILYLDVKSKIESGYFSVKIISPDNHTVYEQSGNNLNEQSEIKVYEGVWHWEVKCYGENGENFSAKNGSYSIVGKLE